MFSLRIIISPSKEMTDHPQIAERRHELAENTELYRAINLYNGLQFRYLRESLTEEDLLFLEDYVRILSAKYGVVKPFDGISPYRLDFQTKGLYKAWSDRIYQSLSEESRLILNLASDEFSKTVTRYATEEDTIITVSFYEEDTNSHLKKHSTISKKGRGQMINYMARNRITDIQEVRSFDDMGYRFEPDHSSDVHWVFIRPKE